MSVKDVVKSSIYDSFTGGTGISFYDIWLILFAACLAGIFIFLVYKNFSKSAFYSKDLNMTLAGMVVVVAAIMVAMQSNLLVSLGMVGALSIVRFRTAVKNPLDLLYLFWAVSEGIICGVGLYVLGAALCVIMPVMLWGLGKLPNHKAPALLVVRVSVNADTGSIGSVIKKNSKYTKKSADSIRNKERELIYEINSAKQEEIMEEIKNMDGIISINWMEHHGEIRA